MRRCSRIMAIAVARALAVGMAAAAPGAQASATGSAPGRHVVALEPCAGSGLGKSGVCWMDIVPHLGFSYGGPGG